MTGRLVQYQSLLLTTMETAPVSPRYTALPSGKLIDTGTVRLTLAAERSQWR